MNRKCKRCREKWGKGEWATTNFLIILFLPIGLAALSRWFAGKEVYYTGFTNGR